MQSDAFPTPPIYVHQFQPRLGKNDFEPQQEGDSDHLRNLLDEIEILMSDCSTEESRSFWSATDRIKIKHRVIASMQMIESLFLDLAIASTQDPEMISAVSASLRYTSTSQFGHSEQLAIPDFLKQRAC
jgi:hypothetical protein